MAKGLTEAPNPFISWHIANATSFPGGESQVSRSVVEQAAWVAVASCVISSFLASSPLTDHVVHEGASARLQSSYRSPNATYNGSDAITVYAAEARNENA